MAGEPWPLEKMRITSYNLLFEGVRTSVLSFFCARLPQQAGNFSQVYPDCSHDDRPTDGMHAASNEYCALWTRNSAI